MKDKYIELINKGYTSKQIGVETNQSASTVKRNLKLLGLKTIYKKDGTLRSTWKNINDVPVYFNDLNKSLLESITTSIKKNDSW